MKQIKHLIIIAGPTASGKTDLAISLAQELKTEIISADSRQFYREMVIGTAVPDPLQLEQVKHHFIGHKTVMDDYNASTYEYDVIDLLQELFSKSNVVIMAGGSGLYIDAVCRGIDELPAIDPAIRHQLRTFYETKGIEGIRKKLEYVDPEYFTKVDLQNPKRILKALEVFEMTGRPYSSFLTGSEKKREFNTIKIGLEQDRKVLYEKINKRVDQMISNGLVEEVRSLSDLRNRNALNTVGYKEIFQYLDGLISLEEAVDLIRRHTRQYARRQITWFRRDMEIKWFNPERIDGILEYVSASLEYGVKK